jgi:peptide/nickel transport system substrate-binding protein
VRLEFEMVFPDQAPFIEIASAIQRDWATLGVRLTLKAVPFNMLVDDYLEPRTYQIALATLDFLRSPDPDPYPFWHQTQITKGQNYSGWNDRQASELLEQARTLVDVPERTRRYYSFQVRFANQMPALPLFYPVYTYGVDTQIQGVSMGPVYDITDRFATITNWFLLVKRAESGETNTPTP